MVSKDKRLNCDDVAAAVYDSRDHGHHHPVTANVVFTDRGQLEDAIRKGMRALQQAPHLIDGCVTGTGLPLDPGVTRTRQPPGWRGSRADQVAGAHCGPAGPPAARHGVVLVRQELAGEMA
ncbi:hypothetical protein [Streptomyces sp. NPDC053560]|uniref:hypothetical protein n=1 Tax=Streptomyces sp. NPDC053560 TaxID=3365711 RepID=UPI0037CFE9C8